jgi:hypothetical protein
MKITAEEFQEWREQLITREVFKAVEDEIESLKRAVADGACLTDSAERSKMLLDRCAGEVRGLQRLLAIDIGDEDE